MIAILEEVNIVISETKQQLNNYSEEETVRYISLLGKRLACIRKNIFRVLSTSNSNLLFSWYNTHEFNRIRDRIYDEGIDQREFPAESLDFYSLKIKFFENKSTQVENNNLLISTVKIIIWYSEIHQTLILFPYAKFEKEFLEDMLGILVQIKEVLEDKRYNTTQRINH